MEQEGTLSLEESLLNEVYNSGQARRIPKGARARYPPTLESLDSQHFRSAARSQSTNSLSDAKVGFTAPSSTRSLKPLQGSQLPSTRKSIQASSTDAGSLRGNMEKVVELHKELENVVSANLAHRADVVKQIADINNKYIQLFELSLSEMLKAQRQKFQSQAQELERLRAEALELQGRLSAAVKTSEMQGEKVLSLRSALFESDEHLTLAKEELTILRNFKKQSDAEKQEAEVRLANAVGTTRHEYETRIKKLRMDLQQQLTTEQLRFAEERLKLNQRQEKSQQGYDRLMEEVLVLREKARALDSLANSVQQRRPLRDNSCQTRTTEAGLWDKQDGWVMPVSQTANIRNLWRRAMKFAACPACRGVGKYVHQVGAILRGVQRGKELIKDAVVEEDLSKWCLPEECVRFLSNLPKTVQGFRAHGLAWSVRCVYNLFALKYVTDREDDALGYMRQPFVDFVIERYLMSTEHRADAELRMYHLIRAVREHYRRHPALQLFARFIGVLDAVTAEEYAAIMHNQHLGEAALKRKREEKLRQMGARERVKHLRDAEQRKEQETVSNEEERVTITTNALSLDILSVTLYARSCMLHAPYMGVYAVPIALAKRQSAMQQTQAHQLRSPPPGTFTADSILPEVYRPDFAATHPIKGSSLAMRLGDGSPTTPSGPRDPVPLHVCVGAHQHYVPLDRAVNVVKQVLHFLPTEELTRVYRELEFNTMFLMDNGTLDLPEGTHSLIRGTMRLFAMSPVEGGFDLSWHDLYRSVADLGNQNEYSAHFIKSAAVKEAATAIPEPIVVPIVGSVAKAKMASAGSDSGDEREAEMSDSDQDEACDEVVVQRRLFCTRDPSASYLDRSMHWEDFAHACALTGASPGAAHAYSDGEMRKGRSQKVVFQDDLLGNHPHQKHYRHLHPETMMVNLDATLQIVAEAMLNKSASVRERIRQVFIEGDTNHDGVLSFSEFTAIVKKVAPEYHERKTLKMFREALMKGDDNECIGPEEFLEVCTAYGLIKIVDVHSLALHQLRALSDPPTATLPALSAMHTRPAAGPKAGKAGHGSPVKDRRRSSLRGGVSKFQHSSYEKATPEQHASPVTKQAERPLLSLSPAKPAISGAPFRNTERRFAKGTKAAAVVEEESVSVEISDEDEDRVAPQQMPPVAPSPAPCAKQVVLSSDDLRIAGIGNTTVASVEKGAPVLRQPVKGRAAPASSVGALALSAEGLAGSGATLQVRRPVPGSEGKVVQPGTRSAPPMSDELDTPAPSPRRKPAPRLMHVLVPSPPKEAAPAPTMASAAASDRASEGYCAVEVQEEPGVRMFALDPAVAQAHLTGARGMKLNEERSKAGASKLLEQLKTKKEQRAQNL